MQLLISMLLYRGAIYWGDGKQQNGTIPNSQTTVYFSPTHTYDSDGNKEIVYRVASLFEVWCGTSYTETVTIENCD